MSPSPKRSKAKIKKPRGNPVVNDDIGAYLLRKQQETELEAAVCKLFCEGVSPSDIPFALAHRYHGRLPQLGREDPYRIIARATLSGRLVYTPATQITLEQDIKNKRPSLKEVRVVVAGSNDDVAFVAATVMLDWLASKAELAESTGDHAPSVGIGWSGGLTLANTAKHVSQLIRRETIRRLPKKIELSSLIGASFSLTGKNPNSFLGWSALDQEQWNPTPGHQRHPEIVYHGLPVPELVPRKDFAALTSCAPIQEALQAARKVQLLCTSAGVWKDPANSLRQLLESRSPRKFERLERECAGDVFWRPLNNEGRLIDLTDEEMDHKIVTPFEDLESIDRCIRSGQCDSLVVIGPRSDFREDRREIVRAIFNSPYQLCTHLVIDHHSVAGVMEALWSSSKESEGARRNFVI
ncbi:MAG: hypothetical protein ACKVP0_27665 [Pirellulaceae bacterium]